MTVADGTVELAQENSGSTHSIGREVIALTQDDEPSPPLENIATEVQLAQLRLEYAKLQHETRKLNRPWWRSWNIAALAALLGAVAPATAGVQGYFDRRKQVTLEEQRQRHEMELANARQIEEVRNRYLERLKEPDQKRRTLRFLVSTANDSSIRMWATKELALLDVAIAKIEADLTAKEKAVEEAEREFADALGASGMRTKDPTKYLELLVEKVIRAREAAEEAHKRRGQAGGLLDIR